MSDGKLAFVVWQPKKTFGPGVQWLIVLAHAQLKGIHEFSLFTVAQFTCTPTSCWICGKMIMLSEKAGPSCVARGEPAAEENAKC